MFVTVNKAEIIGKIEAILNSYGSFTVSEIGADNSPIMDDTLEVSHLAEEFFITHVKVYSYINNEEVNQTEAFYQDLDVEVLEEILELAERWEQISNEEEE